MSRQTARIGDPCTHGAKIITGSNNRFVGGKGVARLGDLVDCPLHGVNKIIGPVGSGLGKNVAHHGSYTECGAKVMTVYNDYGGSGTVVSVDAYQNIIIADSNDIESMLQDGGDERPSPGIPESPEPTETEETPATAPPAVVSTSCRGITDATPDSFQLSTNFTLAQVSTKANYAPAKVVAQRGLTRAQIICNLRELATNCLEPMATKYGRSNIVIGCGFRPDRRGSNDSQHEIGQAADVYIYANGRRASNRVHYDAAIWIKNGGLSYDQLILEYANGPWIHVSFRNPPRAANHANKFGTGYKGSSNTVYHWRKLELR